MRVLPGTAAPALPHSLLPHLYPEHRGRHAPGLPGPCCLLPPDAGKYPPARLTAASVGRGRSQVGRGRVSLLKAPLEPEGSHAPSSPASASLLAHMPRAAFPCLLPVPWHMPLPRLPRHQSPQTPVPSWMSSSLLVPEWSLACPCGWIPEQHYSTGCLPVTLGIPLWCPPCPAPSWADAPGVNCGYLNHTCGGRGLARPCPREAQGPGCPPARRRVLLRLASCCTH